MDNGIDEGSEKMHLLQPLQANGTDTLRTNHPEDSEEEEHTNGGLQCQTWAPYWFTFIYPVLTYIFPFNRRTSYTFSSIHVDT